MVRTQIRFTEEQARRLKTQAGMRGISLAAMIRDYVDQGLAAATPDRAALYERAARFAGTCRDREGARDLGRNHDRYLEEAFMPVRNRAR